MTPPSSHMSPPTAWARLRHWSSGLDWFRTNAPTPATPRGLVLALLIAVIVKFLLIQNEDILAFYLPHDDLWQVRASARAYWGGHYAWDTLIHLPIYPLFIELVRQTGIPLRLAMEAVFCSAGAALAVALFRFGIPAWVAGAAAIAAIFHPASFQLFNRCGPELFLAPLMMLAVAASITWWRHRDGPGRWRLAAWCSLWWALAWNVRKESIVLAAGLAALALMIAITDRSLGLRTALKRVALGAGAPVLASLLVATTISCLNYARFGLFATSMLTAPGFQAAYAALMRLRPEHPIPYVPCTADVRAKAYAISAAFAELKPHLEGAVGKGWADISRQTLVDLGSAQAGPYDSGGGWFYWELHDAVIAAGHGATPGEENRFLAQCAVEIDRGVAEGRANGRLVLIPMVDPDLAAWLPRLPRSLQLVAERCTARTFYAHELQDPAVLPLVGDLYDRQTNRRPHLLQTSTVRIGGWVYAGDLQVRSIGILDADGNRLAAATPTIKRNDIEPRFPIGFLVEMRAPTAAAWATYRVEVIDDLGQSHIKPMRDITQGIVPLPSDGKAMTLGIDTLQPPILAKRTSWAVQERWEDAFLILIRWATWLMIPGALVLFIGRKQSIALLPILLCAAIITSRIGLFAVLDATAWPGYIPRYLFCIMVLYNVMVVLILWESASLLCDWFRRPKTAPKSPDTAT